MTIDPHGTSPAGDEPESTEKAESTMIEPPASATAAQSPEPSGAVAAEGSSAAESQPATADDRPGEKSSADESHDEIDVSSPAKVMRIGTMVKQLLDEVRSTDLDEKGRERLAKIHRRSIDELEDGLSKELIDELERLDLPFDTENGPPTTSELRIAQAQLVGWLEGLFHGIQTAIMAQQAMAKQSLAAQGQLPPGMMRQAPGQPGVPQHGSDEDTRERGAGNYL